MKKSKKIDTLVLLRYLFLATAVAGIGYSILPSDQPEQPKKPRDNSTGYLVENPDGIYTIFRTDTKYPDKEAATIDHSKFCYQIGSETDKFPSIQNSLNSLEKTGDAGEHLHIIAEDESIFFCKKNEPIGNANAIYKFHYESVYYNYLKFSNEQLMSTTAHELAHAEQDSRDLAKIDINWDLKSLMRFYFAMEAPAVTAQIIVAFEAKQAGNDKLWDLLKTGKRSAAFKKNDPMLEEFNDNYETQKAMGRNHKQAIEFSGQEAWKTVIKNEIWIESYAKTTIEKYSKRLDSNHKALRTIGTNMPSNETISALANIGGYNFGEGLTIDSFKFEDGTDIFDLIPAPIKAEMADLELRRQEIIKELQQKPVPLKEMNIGPKA